MNDRATLRIIVASCAGLPGLLGFVQPSAHASDYFVATTGDDTNAGTESAPFKTIQRGADAATAPGDTVWIRGGVYGSGWDDQLNPTNSGTATAPITFRAYPGELPILDGSAIDGGASGVEPTSAAVAYVRVMGLALVNWGTSGLSNGWDFASSNIAFTNCVADNNGVNGIAFDKADNVHIEGNIVSHNGALEPSWSSGINLYAAGGTNTLAGNVSFENIDVSCWRSTTCA